MSKSEFLSNFFIHLAAAMKRQATKRLRPRRPHLPPLNGLHLHNLFNNNSNTSCFADTVTYTFIIKISTYVHHKNLKDIKWNEPPVVLHIMDAGFLDLLSFISNPWVDLEQEVVTQLHLFFLWRSISSESYSSSFIQHRRNFFKWHNWKKRIMFCNKDILRHF